MVRELVWRVLAVAALACTGALVVRFADGGVGELVRSGAGATHEAKPAWIAQIGAAASAAWQWAPVAGVSAARSLLTLASTAVAGLAMLRSLARRRRCYVRMRVAPYRTDRTEAAALVAMLEALHGRVAEPWARRLLLGQPSVGLEVHFGSDGVAWLGVCCQRGLERLVATALAGAYPNCRMKAVPDQRNPSGVLVRLRKRGPFIVRAKALDHFAHAREPPVNRLLKVMSACGEPCCVQLALTPAPSWLEAIGRRLHASREGGRARGSAAVPSLPDRRTMIEDAELRGGLEVVKGPLFYGDVRVLAGSRRTCRRIAAELRTGGGENRLVERHMAVRHRLLGLYARRLARGEGNPLPSPVKGVYAPSELAALWQLPSLDFSAVPLERSGVPVAPAPPGIRRAREGEGTLRDELGPVSVDVELRKQNTAVPGTVEQGKTSYLVASVAEDLRRPGCAVIVVDPKGDAADAAISLVPPERTCTLLDLAHPTCGFNPLSADAPADVIADYVVAALRNLFSDADIRASSDRYLRNAIIAVLAYDRCSTLWDAARLLSVGDEGQAFRRRVAARVRELPEFKEVAEFFAAELSVQLIDSRSTTTAKLDAPVNKLARLLNSPSIKRVLLNESLRVDFDRVISGCEVLVVKGALGVMGAGNTSVLMQLLMGMLDAALARQQDLVQEARRMAVALKVDEAPLVLNRGFAETMALKRSAGLETVACWQTEAQWEDRELRSQLDALFAHRVYFATASAHDAREAAALTMPEFSDTVRAGLADPATLGRPDVRLHLPKHHAIASWCTAAGRQPAFVAQTLPMGVDDDRLSLHAAYQYERGGRYLSDLRQPHWDRSRDLPREELPAPPAPPAAEPDRTCHATASASAPSSIPSESYAELVELDRAEHVRAVRSRAVVKALEPDRLDVEILSLIASFRHVLSSQLHRRFNASRAATTTQRRLKRLADAGLVERFQFHRRDGGGVPMCYAITAAGIEIVRTRADSSAGSVDRAARRAIRPGSDLDGPRALRQARHDVHVVGWMLALSELLDARCAALRGPDEAALTPPRRQLGAAERTIGLDDLRLPGARAAHGFVRTRADGRRVDVERFDTVRPDALVQAGAVDLFVEFDDRVPRGSAAAKLERYDHFLAGWSAHLSRYGTSARATPEVVFVCRDRRRADECARAADAVLCACRAYAGEYPADWDYRGRRSIAFAAERDIHEGSVQACGVERLPPELRVAAAGDPRAAEAAPRRGDILADVIGR